MYGVKAKPRKASQVWFRGKMPKWAAQLTAANPIRARSPEAVPVRNALMKINIELPVSSSEHCWIGLRSGNRGELRSVPAQCIRLFALGLRRDPHGSVKQMHYEELEDGDQERPSVFPNIMLEQTYPGIQQLHGAGQRTQH